ncbi:MAG TPA: DUF1592 domain-containing protein [Polyangiaceae bacterium]|nr:DUF1592 domain-containing protein [Polyangiaceae bacterium]
MLALGCTGEVGGNPTSSPNGSGGPGGPGGPGGGGSGNTAGSGGSTAAEELPPFAPAGASFKRLTATEFKSSLVALLGPVTVGNVENDTWVNGFAKVGGSTVSISLAGVELYQRAIDTALAEVFADAARRDAFVGCMPQGATDSTCYRSFVERFGRLAWRRALTTAQADRLVTLATSVAQTLGGAHDGLRAAAKAILMSPNFLYRLERGEPDAALPGSWSYTGYELASRLAFFLTNGPPDNALLLAAEQGQLATPAGIQTAAERLLSETAGRESVANFASELFQLAIVLARAKDPAIFPTYTAAMQEAMVREVPSMLQDLVFEQAAPVTDFFTTRTTFVNADLAQLYGLDATGLTSDSWVKVTLPADGKRAGFLGTGAFLSLFANQKEGSPTLRGKFIRSTLMCGTIPNPPPDVAPVFEESPTDAMTTKREKLAQHREKGSTCEGCHALMDPLGLPLENFDAIGAYRETEHGKQIDATGNLDGVDFNGPVELGQLLSTNELVASCLVRNLYRYATGVFEAPGQETVIRQLTNQFQSEGRDMRKLMVTLVASDGFRLVAPTL